MAGKQLASYREGSMYRRTAGLCEDWQGLDLGGFADALKKGKVRDNIQNIQGEPGMGDRVRAWYDFIGWLKADFDDFYSGSDVYSTIGDLAEDLGSGSMDGDIFDDLWDKVEDWVDDQLYDDFVNAPAAGEDFLDRLCGIFKGMEITCYFTVRAGEIE